MAETDNTNQSVAEAEVAANRYAQSPSVVYLNNEVDLGCVIRFQPYSFNSGQPDRIGITDLIAEGLASVNVDLLPSNSFVLPLPKQLVDNLNINAQGKELNITGNLAANAAAQAGDASFATLLDSLSGIMNTAGDIGADFATQARALFTGQAADLSNTSDTVQYLIRAGLGGVSPQIGSGIDAGRGTTVNPYQALTFDGVALKQHTLNFEFAPESEAQSRNLAKVIRQLQYNSLPSYAGVGTNEGSSTSISRGLLRYPAIMYVAFFGLDNKYFYEFKPSMLSNVSVDYTPHGNSILRGATGGRPAFVNLTLTFVEQSIWTRDDVAYFDGPDLGTED